MDFFNCYGLAIMCILMLPNIIFAVRSKGNFKSSYKNKTAEISEQAGRLGCFIFMVFNIPGTYLNFWFGGAFFIYIAVNAVLCLAYIVCWISFFIGINSATALLLSVIPCCIFIFSGITLLNFPLIVSAVVFSPCHILITCKNNAKSH